MNVKLLAYTQINKAWLEEWPAAALESLPKGMSDGQAVCVTAIRTCYSSNKPTEIIELEGEKYFKKEASDGQGGNDADRLIRHIMNSGHTSTIEHINFTFAIEGVSRSLLAQITRHRHLSFSVQSQRYVKFGSEDKSGGFNYTWPPSISEQPQEIWDIYSSYMEQIQEMYDELREAGISAEDARMVLPNAATTNLVMTGNLRSLLDFYSKRSEKGAQWEIRELAEMLKEEIVKAEPWTEAFFKLKKK
ncbi:FAD-dependent thymidylate synthase [Priestia aryabhattai]|uniref:FAD-dependent thymidylate synthase n=1 Tax=Priestia aryabhattai TaxID=412384 RepID=UPI003C893764